MAKTVQERTRPKSEALKARTKTVKAAHGVKDKMSAQLPQRRELSEELIAKMIELMQEIRPGFKRSEVFGHHISDYVKFPGNEGNAPVLISNDARRFYLDERSNEIIIQEADYPEGQAP